MAKCEGEIQVELIDTSGARVMEDLSDYRIEVRQCRVSQPHLSVGPVAVAIGSKSIDFS